VTTDRVAGAVLVLLGLFVLWESRVLPLGSLRNPGPGYMPVVLALLVAAFGAAIALTGGASPRLRALGWGESRRAATIVAAGAFAALALERLGYRITMAALLLFLFGVVERRHPLFAVVCGLGLALLTFYVFDTVLRVPLPRGPLGL
jgi:putative tricarboxylic transport membrane protein